MKHWRDLLYHAVAQTWYPLIFLALAASALSCLHAQTSSPSPATGIPDHAPLTIEPDAIRNVDHPRDPKNPLDDPDIEARLARIRAKEQQKRIVEDANRLVALTARYRQALIGHGTPTVEDQKLLTEVEKLARSVKDRMNGL